MDPQQRMIAEEFDGYRDTYNEAVNQAISFSGQTVDAFTRAKAADLLKQIAARFSAPKDVAVADIGCGVGNFHAFLEPVVGSISGIDVSSACIARAKERHPNVRYDVYDGSHLPYDSASFDVAFCVCVIHHVPPQQWQTFVTELCRIVRPGGMVAVYEHNPWNPLTRYVVGSCAFDRDAVLVAMPKMRELLHNAGCTDVTTRSILTLPPRGAMIEKADAMFSRLPFGAQYRAIGRIAGPTP
ncbi:MAG: class I SAM-dependent methyltransferase [Hyphomicrobium sp.]